MADFLGGLLGGGGGLYDDLLTPQQQSQLSSRGLLAMAGAFADAGMPSRLPIPLGAAIGKAAAAMGTGRDQAALQVLQAQKLAQEVQTQKIQAALQQQMFNDFKNMPLSEFLKRHAGAAGSGAATPPAAATTAASTIPGGGATAPVPAGSAAQLDDPSVIRPDDPGPGAAPSITQYGMPPRQNLSPFTGLRPFGTPVPAGGVMGTAPPLPPGDAPPPDAPGSGASLNDRYGGILAMAGGPGGASGSSLPPPDELIRQRNGPGGLLQASYTGAPPFGQTPGAGGDDEVGSGGGAADAGRQARVDFWQSQGAPAHVAQGIADRVNAESGFKPGAMGDSNTSGGLYQHHADRLTRLQSFAAGQGKAWTDPNVQDQFAASEVRGGDAIAAKHWPEIMAAPTRDAAATLWDKYFERSKYGPGAGGLPGGGSGGGAAPGASGAPTPPVPPGVDPQAMNTLLLELARRNAMAEILKLGNPYGSMLSVLQGSPAYQGQIETAKRGAGLPFVGPEEAAKRGAGYPFDVAMEAFKTQNAAFLKDKEQLGAAALDPAPNGILTRDSAGNTIRVQGTKLQAAAAARGLGVPELGIPALVKPPPGATGPAVSPVGEPVYTETEKAIGANAAKAFGEQRDAAQAAAQQIKINNESLRLLDSGTYTGWDANLALSMARIFGIQGKDTAEKVQNTQLFVLQRMQQAAEAVKAQPGSASDKDLAFANRMAVGDITLEPGTIRQGMEIYNRFNLEKIREHNRNAAGIAPGVTSGIRQTVDEPPTYERSQGTTPGGNRWARPPGR